MVIEYVLLLVVVFAFGLKLFVSAPMDAFKESAPKLGARVEKQLETGSGFNPAPGNQKPDWNKDSQ